MEMPGPWKAWKSKSSFSPLSTAPWESRQRREIPTFPQPGIAPDGKVENQNQVSHFPTRGMRRRPRFVYLQNQEPRKEIGRFAASSITVFRITLDWKQNSVSGSSFDWKMLCRRYGTRKLLIFKTSWALSTDREGSLGQCWRRGLTLEPDRDMSLKILWKPRTEIRHHWPTRQSILCKLLILLWRRGGDSNPR